MRDETRRRELPIALMMLLALSIAGPAVAQQQHTWTDVERIVAVGDVHGDYGQFVKVLRAAGVIDEKNNWAAGKTHLVQTGDVLDRGPDSRKAMDLLMALEVEAAKAGGCVHALIGNHEAMVLDDDWRYLHPGEIKAFGDEKQFREAMGPKGKYGQWIRGHNAAIKINDALFVHGGLAGKFTEVGLDEINNSVRKHLTEGGKPDDAAMHPSGPLWCRVQAVMVADDLKEEMDALCKTHKIAHVVVGHTVMMKGITVRDGGRVIAIDVGMCKFYGGRAGCLIIEKGKFYEVYIDQKKPTELDLKAEAEKELEPAVK